VTPFQRTAAIFDVDDSLLAGNAGTIFTWYLYSQKIMRADLRSRLPRAVYDYARGRLGEADMVALASKAHLGLSAEELHAHARRCFERHIRHRITAEGLRTVRRHLLAGHLVVVASGSPQAIIDEVGRFLGAHQALGTRARFQGGMVTDELLLPLTFQEGKRDRVRAVCTPHDIDLARSYLYSDSVADTPLFECVGNPVVINPKAPFRKEAERRGWEVREWRGRWGDAPEDDALAGAEPEGDGFPAEEWRSWGG